MVIVKKAVLIAAGVIVAALGVAAPSGADPSNDPCELGVTFLCHFLPMAPDLDHDIDLTQNPGLVEGQPVPQMPQGSLNTENLPPVDICAVGCV